MDSNIVVKKAEKLKAEFKKLRERKNVQKYEKHVEPLVAHILKLGIGSELVTIIAILLALLTTLFLIQKMAIVASIFLALTGVASFVDGIVARETNSQNKLDKFYHAIADVLIENIILFGMVFYFYMDNYFMLVLTLLLIVLMNLNHHLLLLSRFFKLKKIDAVFYRPEFFVLISVGLFLGLLGLFLALSFMLTVVTTSKLTYQVHQQLKPVFAERASTPKRKKKS